MNFSIANSGWTRQDYKAKHQRPVPYFLLPLLYTTTHHITRRHQHQQRTTHLHHHQSLSFSFDPWGYRKGRSLSLFVPSPPSAPPLIPLLFPSVCVCVWKFSHGQTFPDLNSNIYCTRHPKGEGERNADKHGKKRDRGAKIRAILLVVLVRRWGKNVLVCIIFITYYVRNSLMEALSTNLK